MNMFVAAQGGAVAAHILALRASERKKGRYVVLIGGLKGADIAAPKISLLHDVCPAPGEYWLVLRPYQHIGHKPCMTTIAVGEGMDRDQTMMKPDGYLIGWIGLVFEPMAGVTQ
jgi:hypothetical protein